ncbi:MAG: hypothetical protein OEV91_05975, partial [Desulfobulbaceae bacterium]|nr:hypothetical protein [Desulfobulbaceae bacterium]
MKRFLILVLACLIVLPMARAAYAAGGAGPPKDIMKGVFLEVNPQSRVALFEKSPTADTPAQTVTLTIPESMPIEDIKLHRKMLVSLDSHAAVPGTVKEASIMFMDMTPQKIVALIVIGLIGGLLSGFIGSGGAFVLTPAMMSLGAPGAVAVAS